MNKSLVLAADPSRLAASRLRFRAGSRRSLPSGRLDRENRPTWSCAGPNQSSEHWVWSSVQVPPVDLHAVVSETPAPVGLPSSS